MNKLQSRTPMQQRASVIVVFALIMTVAMVIGVMALAAPANAAPPTRPENDQIATIHARVANTGTITIVKQATPADGADFTFASDIPGHASFQLDDAVPDDGDAITDTITIDGIASGAYSVSEDALVGWTATGVQCDDSNSIGIPSEAKAEIQLEADEAVTCIFENRETAVIVEESDGESHVEEGAQGPPLRLAGYTVRLSSPPLANVRIEVTTDDQVVVDKTVLNLGPSNWNIPQYVYIYAVNDNFEEDDLHFGLVTHNVSSSDPNYNDVPAGYQTPFEGNRKVGAINPETDGKARTIEVAVNDNDLAAVNLEVIGDAPPLLEGSIQQRFYNVQLNTEPRADVIVTIQADAQVDADKTQVVFTPKNWAVRRAVEVTIVDDDDIEGDHVGQVIHGAQSSDADYDDPGAIFQAIGPTGGPQPNIVQIDIIDDDFAGLISTPELVFVEEGGPTVFYKAALGGKPTADVTVQIATDDQVTTDVTQLTYTTLNWNIPQPIYVTAVDDNDTEGPHFSDIVHTFVSADPNFQIAPPAIVEVEITDNDKPGLIISPRILALAEGETTTYQIVLTTQPTADVTVDIFSGVDGQVTVNPAALTFAPEDWDTPQLITVTAVDDDVDESAPDETHSAIISHSVKSSDPQYNSGQAGRISINITDNDTTGVLVTSLTVQTTEDGDTDTYTLVLNSSPTKLMRVRVLFEEAQVNVTPSVIAFDHNNWDELQTVTVSAVDDDWAEGDHESVLRHETSSDDPHYNAQPVEQVEVEIEDNNQAGLAVWPTEVTVAEGGFTDSYSVTLTSQPVAAVTVEVLTTEQVNADALSLTFVPELWDESQVVTLSAVDDDLDESTMDSIEHKTTVVHKVNSTDAIYDGIPGVDVDVTILDNDRPRMLLPLIQNWLAQ